MILYHSDLFSRQALWCGIHDEHEDNCWTPTYHKHYNNAKQSFSHGFLSFTSFSGSYFCRTFSIGVLCHSMYIGKTFPGHLQPTTKIISTYVPCVELNGIETQLWPSTKLTKKQPNKQKNIPCKQGVLLETPYATDNSSHLACHKPFWYELYRNLSYLFSSMLYIWAWRIMVTITGSMNCVDKIRVPYIVLDFGSGQTSIQSARLSCN